MNSAGETEYNSEYIKSLSLEAGFAKYLSVKELDTAINDLLAQNYFSLVENPAGPYELEVGLAENRLVFNIKPNEKSKIKTAKINIPLRAFRSIIKDYFLVCESYQDMLKTGHSEKVEAIDAGRRALHNEGAEILLKLLEERINLDFETARRLFTIITVLHM